MPATLVNQVWLSFASTQRVRLLCKSRDLRCCKQVPLVASRFTVWQCKKAKNARKPEISLLGELKVARYCKQMRKVIMSKYVIAFT